MELVARVTKDQCGMQLHLAAAVAVLMPAACSIVLYPLVNIRWKLVPIAVNGQCLRSLYACYCCWHYQSFVANCPNSHPLWSDYL